MTQNYDAPQSPIAPETFEAVLGAISEAFADRELLHADCVHQFLNRLEAVAPALPAQHPTESEDRRFLDLAAEIHTALQTRLLLYTIESRILGKRSDVAADRGPSRLLPVFP